MQQRQDTTAPTLKEPASQLSQRLAEHLQDFVKTLLVELDDVLDKRLVRTFLATLTAIIKHRHRACGLLLSELGGYLLCPEQAPAGTKRLSRLLRSKKWTHALIERYLWRQAQHRLDELEAEGQQALMLWDESVLEKPESIALEGLCAVRSSKARRLKRIKPGFFNPPGGRPIFVPGMNWLGVLLLGMQGAPTLAALRWWTTRGLLQSDRRSEATALLKQCAQTWQRRVLHIWDRGYAGSPWLRAAAEADVRFIVRWPKHYKLIDGQGQRCKAWQIARGKRSWGKRLLWDARRGTWRKTGVVALPVAHAEYPLPLWLVVSRPGKGRTPWYLLTNEPVETESEAWRVVLAYARRWQIEMAWRYTKSELAMQSPRLWFWDNRLKLLMIVAVVYAFLLSLLRPESLGLRQELLRRWCHRTGKRSREASTPLYRVRMALSRLWLAHPPKLTFPDQSPG